MDEITLLNTLLIYFYEQRHSHLLLPKNLNPAFQELQIDTSKINFERLCEQLKEDFLLYKEHYQPNTINVENRYSISTKGILHFSNLPEGYSRNPYSYYLFLQHEDYKRKQEKERLERESIQANINVSESVELTNKSSRDLATETENFYTKQTGFNKWQKILTVAIFLSTAGYTVISFFMLRNQNKQLEQGKTQLQQPIDSIKSQLLQDSAFLNSLKNSLKGR